MKRYLLFIISIICYLIGTGGLFYFIGWMGDLLPWHPFHQLPSTSVSVAIWANLGLLALFGLQHSIMARKEFKSWFTKYVPASVERSIYVLMSGLLCFLIAWQWQSIEGVVWTLAPGSVMSYFLMGLYFFGIVFLLASSFLINHFELFGLQQTYFHLMNKKKGPPSFVEFAFYRVTRHPIYLGLLLIIWSTPSMTFTRLALALGITLYIYIGIYFEEKDLVAEFGAKYEDYRHRVPKLIPGASPRRRQQPDLSTQFSGNN